MHTKHCQLSMIMKKYMLIIAQVFYILKFYIFRLLHRNRTSKDNYIFIVEVKPYLPKPTEHPTS